MEIELKGENLKKSFGGVAAVQSVSFYLKKGEILSFVGPNGAGKTTMFNLITGFLRADGGEVFYKSTNITNIKPHKLLSLGICRSWQNVRLHWQLSVIDNLALAMSHPAGENPAMAVFRSGYCRQEDRLKREKAMQYLEVVNLAHKAEVIVAQLSYPEQKSVALARLMATEATTWLLDEPLSGFDRVLINKQMLPLLRTIVDKQGISVVLVEHNLDVIRGLCSRVYFMEEGRVIAEGHPEELMKDPYLNKVYFCLECE